MQVSHSVSAVFDDPNLVSAAGLAPVLALAERAGLHGLVAEHLTVPGSAGASLVMKVPSLVAGMVAGADSITDMDLLRHGGMGQLFTEVRAPTTVGTCLRGFTFGPVRQLDEVASRLLMALAGRTPLVAGADQLADLDIDDTMRATHGYAQQGAGYGYTKVEGLNALLAIISTPIAAPVIAATRLRTGSTNSARGAARLITDSLATARMAGAVGQVSRRCDSAYYTHDLQPQCRRGCSPGRGALLGHRPEGSVGHRPEGSVGHRPEGSVGHRPEGSGGGPGDRLDRRRGLGGGQVSDRDLGRGRGPLDLRRRGRRDSLHRLPPPPQGRAHHRPPDRAPGQAAEPRLGSGWAERAVRRLAPSRGVHRLSAADARCRGRPPRPCARRGRPVGPFRPTHPDAPTA